MSGAPTLFHGELGAHPESVELDADEADHVRALRLVSGDRIRVTDGAGSLYRGVLLEVGQRGARVRIEEPVAAPEPLPVELAFGVARKSRTLWMVEKAVELGVAALQPVECRRSRSVADAGRSAAFWEKARRRAIAALKQSGRARLPDLRPVTTLEEYIQERAAWSGPAILLAVGGGATLRERLAGWDGRNPARIFLGPEGGLEPGEAESLTGAGWREASLGPGTLRFETAAVAALAVVGQERADARRRLEGGADAREGPGGGKGPEDAETRREDP